MAGKLTQLEQLRHLIRNKVSCIVQGYTELSDALTDGLEDDHKDITVRQLMRHEGFEPKPYKCPAGKLTLGFGKNIEDGSIPYEVALFWLEYDVEDCDKLLSEKLSFYHALSDNRKSVLINMCFNLGFKGLTKFKRMMLELIKEDYKAAAKEMIRSKWASQVGQRALELEQLMIEG